MTKSCPNCQNQNTQNFYNVKNAPVQSCSIIRTIRESQQIPKVNISLSYCKKCGFIFNSYFNPEHAKYSDGYEDQQGFSPTFNQFSNELARSLIEKYQIYDKDIVEIGCGKGDFLVLLCQLGNNRGLGIDPAYVEGRIVTSAQIRFKKEFYSEKHAGEPSDLICCRHTLEHISNTFDFLKLLRQTIGKDLDKIVFFEVPDVVRILKDYAFWDIYYEHCSYFSPASLAHLFRSTGFEILDIYNAYSDQYLLIEAQPIAGISEKMFTLEENPQHFKSLIDKFTLEIERKINEWNQRMVEFQAEKKRVILWGAGSKAVGFLSSLNDYDAIEYVTDINPHLADHYLPGFGKKIVSPRFLQSEKPDVVIIMNDIYVNEIKNMLLDMNIHCEIYFL